MKMLIGDEAVDVSWEDNDAVAALGQEVQKQPLAVEMVMYEDFEQVGELGVDLPANDDRKRWQVSSDKAMLRLQFRVR